MMKCGREGSRERRNSLLILILGIGMGIAAKWFDLHSEFFGTMFSNLAVWILLASAVSFHSRTPWRAGFHVLLFLGGMVVAYYAAAQAMGGVWSTTFLLGWGAAALLSPIPGYFVWYARGRSLRAWVLSVGVVVFQIAATILLFDKLRLSDALAVLLTAALLLRDKLGSGGKA